MSIPGSTLRKASNSAPEPKPRGANRSTKVAGKLKVLPEQPDNLPSLDTKPKTPTAERTHTESTGTTGESEDGEADEDSQEEDVEVRRTAQVGTAFVLWTDRVIHSNRYTTRYPLFLKVRLEGMR